MKYTIIVGNSSGKGLEDFENEINDMLIDGWKLQGGICVIERPDEFDNPFLVYYQAMIRDENA